MIDELLDIQAAFEPVESWYCAEGAAVVPTLADMIGHAVEDLQRDRAVVLAVRAELDAIYEAISDDQISDDQFPDWARAAWRQCARRIDAAMTAEGSDDGE